MACTLVSFHAHPDDESLLTGGTLARAAAEGHRVVLVTATDGAAGLTSEETRGATIGHGGLGAARSEELARAADALGVARVVELGYPDGSFAAAGLDGPAGDLVRVLEQERAELLTGYDGRGGYGHPDHVHVHHVARRAAALAGTPFLLEVTVDRSRLLRAARFVSWLPGTPAIDLDALGRSYSDREEITHTVDVRAQLGPKLAALAAHHSQSVGNGRSRRGRTVGLLTGLPTVLTGPVLGREWFIEADTNTPGAAGLSGSGLSGSGLGSIFVPTR